MADDQTAPIPRSVTPVDYGVPAALWLAAQKSGVLDLLLSLDHESRSGPSPAHFLLLAAFDRLCGSQKTTEIAEWYERSVLRSLWNSLWGFASEDFAAEKFRECFERIAASPNELQTLQSRLLELWRDKKLVGERLLAYDLPGFYTYIANSEDDNEGRSNIRRLGVSYVLDGENLLSLCHRVYDGNAADSEPFPAVISRVNQMLDHYGLGKERVTLVSGKSSAALAHIEDLEAAGLGWITALTWDQTPPDFRARTPDQLSRCSLKEPGIRAVAERVHLYGGEHLCVLKHSQTFQARQVQGLTISLSRATQYLRHFARQLNNANTRVSEEKAHNRIRGWLAEEYVSELVHYQLHKRDGKLHLEYEVDERRLQWLLNHRLGRTFLLTNRLDWTTEELVESFSAQEMVDDVFRGLHEGNPMAWKGSAGWTELDLRIHTFYCMLAVSLLQFMYKPVRKIWPEVSLELLLEELQEIKQFILVYPSAAEQQPERVATVLSEQTLLQQALAQVTGIDKLETTQATAK